MDQRSTHLHRQPAYEQGYVVPTPEQIQARLVEARRLQSQAMAQMLSGAGRGVGYLARSSAEAIARWNRSAGTRHTGVMTRQTQGRAAAEAFTAVFRGISCLARPGAEAIARWIRRAATRGALMACSDRVLADIGIERADIPAVARASSARSGTKPGNWQAALARRLESARERRRIYRELMAYSDRELDELGVRPSDIPEIARAA